MSKLNAVDDAFNKGYDAALKGKSQKNNPYSDPTLRDEWEQGYEAAQQEED